MNKETYLRFLRAYLTGRLPGGEVEEIMRYYTEYFEDAGEVRESTVMAELGSPEHLARQILGQRSQENMIPVAGPGSGQDPYPSAPYPVASRGGIPGWAYVLILVAAAIFVGPVLAALVFGLGLAGIVCVLVGLGLAAGSLGRLSFPGILYQWGGGLISAAVGLLLMLGAILLVYLTAKVFRWFRSMWVEGGVGDEGSC